MNDEIKEILKLIGSCCYNGTINDSECEKYCNYITSLEKENKILRENAIHNDKVVDKAIFIYETRNTVDGKKLRFFKGKHTHGLMYEALKGK